MNLCSTGFKWKNIILLPLLMMASQPLFSQKVGLVLSGGGAKGLAHIGMLKALEENNIPIDYIVGTSMGGIVGGFYAAGYSVEEIENIARSKEFQRWITGKYESDYRYYFKKSEADPSFLEAKLRVDSSFHPHFSASISNDIPLNFALLEMLAQASVNSGFDFDSLFVPFRCVVADIFTQNTIVLENGSLSNALRGTMSVPFFYRPVKVQGKYVFDGGLYNNFPVDILKDEFDADVIIGSNTSSKIYNEYPEEIDERLLSKMTVFLFLSKSDSTLLDENGVFINPDLSKFSATDFDPVETYIQIGYKTAMRQMDKIKRLITRRVDKEALQRRRKLFNTKAPPIRFADIKVKGGNSKQREYVTRMFGQNKQWLSLSDVKEGYYRLVADENFESVYPKVIVDSLTKQYIFQLTIEADDELELSFGGNIATRPISNVFLGFQYNFLDNRSYTLGGKFYSGRFYESAQMFARMDVPWRTPWFLRLNFTYNHWNYLRSSEIFIENLSPTYIEQIDRKFELTLGLPGRTNGRYEFSAANIMLDNRFYFNDQASDSLFSKSKFDGFKFSAIFDRNTLNRKQYASQGGRLLLGLYAFTGKEKYNIGEMPQEGKRHTWWMARFKNENYFRTSSFSSLGYIVEAVWTNQPYFSTEKSTLLLAPTYYPFPDTKSVYLENLRAQKYLALGLRNIFTFYDNFDLRLEAHIFKPYKRITDINASFDLTDVSFLGSAALVYNSPLGPVSLNTSYYDDNEKRWGLLFHIGYLIYNKRANE